MAWNTLLTPPGGVILLRFLVCCLLLLFIVGGNAHIRGVTFIIKHCIFYSTRNGQVNNFNHLTAFTPNRIENGRGPDAQHFDSLYHCITELSLVISVVSSIVIVQL